MLPNLLRVAISPFPYFRKSPGARLPFLQFYGRLRATGRKFAYFPCSYRVLPLSHLGVKGATIIEEYTKSRFHSNSPSPVHSSRRFLDYHGALGFEFSLRAIRVVLRGRNIKGIQAWQRRLAGLVVRM